MKKYFLVIVLLLGAGQAWPNEGQLGIIIGSTSGVSAKYDLGQDRALDAAFSYSIEDRYGLSVHGDYLFNRFREFKLGELSPLFMYYGVGLRLMNIRSGKDEGSTRAGLRVPFGVLYRTTTPDLEFFGELVPILDVAPRSDVFLDLGLGVRVIF